MQVNEPDRRGLDGSVIYRSAMNVKTQRAFPGGTKRHRTARKGSSASA